MDKIPVASEEAAHVHAAGYAGSSPAVPHRGNTNIMNYGRFVCSYSE